MKNFPKLPHQSAGGGIECPGFIVAEGWPMESMTTLRCDECGVVVGHYALLAVTAVAFAEQ